MTTTSPPSGYTLKPLKEGLKCNTDRDFKITTVPSSLQDASVLVGPLYFEAGGTMSFSTSAPTIVYLAVESGTPCIPCLKNSNKWTKTGEVLVVGGSMRYPIYSRTFGSTSVKIEYSKEGLGAYLNHGHQNLVIITNKRCSPAKCDDMCRPTRKYPRLLCSAPAIEDRAMPWKTDRNEWSKCLDGLLDKVHPDRLKWFQLMGPLHLGDDNVFRLEYVRYPCNAMDHGAVVKRIPQGFDIVQSGKVVGRGVQKVGLLPIGGFRDSIAVLMKRVLCLGPTCWVHKEAACHTCLQHWRFFRSHHSDRFTVGQAQKMVKCRKWKFCEGGKHKDPDGNMRDRMIELSDIVKAF